VFVRKYEDIVILFPKRSPWAPLINSLDKFTDDFMAERNQPEQQERRGL
jgi:antitoxin VapB